MYIVVTETLPVLVQVARAARELVERNRLRAVRLGDCGPRLPVHRLEPELAELRARRLDARGPRLPHPRLLAEPPVLRLVERFDIEPFPDFSAK